LRQAAIVTKSRRLAGHTLETTTTTTMKNGIMNSMLRHATDTITRKNGIVNK
jgi:hypothetical protein